MSPVETVKAELGKRLVLRRRQEAYVASSVFVYAEIRCQKTITNKQYKQDKQLTSTDHEIYYNVDQVVWETCHESESQHRKDTCCETTGESEHDQTRDERVGASEACTCTSKECTKSDGDARVGNGAQSVHKPREPAELSADLCEV